MGTMYVETPCIYMWGFKKNKKRKKFKSSWKPLTESIIYASLKIGLPGSKEKFCLSKLLSVLLKGLFFLGCYKGSTHACQVPSFATDCISCK